MRDAEPPQLEHVAEVPGRDESRLGAEALEHGVRRDGGAVDDLAPALARPLPASPATDFTTASS